MRLLSCRVDGACATARPEKPYFVFGDSISSGSAGARNQGWVAC